MAPFDDMLSDMSDPAMNPVAPQVLVTAVSRVSDVPVVDAAPV